MQHADKFVIRLPEGMRDRIRENAEANRRTMNAEILHYIDQAMAFERETATTGEKFGDPTPAAAEDHNTHKERCDAANT